MIQSRLRLVKLKRFGEVPRPTSAYRPVSFLKWIWWPCVGQDFRQQDVELLESRNVDLEGLEYMDGQTFRWKGEYGYDLNEAQNTGHSVECVL